MGPGLSWAGILLGGRLIYATMTPFMPEKYLNPSYAQHDVEDKNALAVKTGSCFDLNGTWYIT